MGLGRGQVRGVGGLISTDRFDNQPVFAPFGQATVHAARVQAAGAKRGDGLVGMDAVETATTGDDLGVQVEPVEHPIEIGKRRVQHAGNMCCGVFARRPEIEHRDGTLGELRSQIGAAHRRGRDRAARLGLCRNDSRSKDLGSPAET